MHDLPGTATGVLLRVLQRALGRPLALRRTELIREGGRSVVTRCYLADPGADPGPAGIGDAPADAPATVVVKQFKPGTTLGFTDWAALDFLSTLERGTPPDPPPGTPSGPATAMTLAPYLYGGDADGRLVVLQDLGGQDSLDTLLQREVDPGAPPAIETALQTALDALAAQYARMHAAGIGREADFAAACRRVPLAAPQGRQAEAQRWLAGLERVERWRVAAACASPDGWPAVGQRIAAVYARPGGWLTFTHGDPAPTNNHVGPDPADVHLLDFEYGDYRHALYDMTAWAVLCPLPAPLLARMRRRYRRELAPALPDAGRDRAFDLAWGTLMAYRALALLSWIPVDVMERNVPWVGTWTAREAILVVLERLHRATAGLVDLDPIARLAGALASALRRRWTEFGDAETAPRWPATAGLR